MRILVRADRAGKKFHASHPFALFSGHISEGSIVRFEGRPHQLYTEHAVAETRGLTHRDFNSLHSLEDGNIEFAPHKRHPDGFRDLWMQGLFWEPPGDGVLSELGLVLESLSAPTQDPPTAPPTRVRRGHDQPLGFEPGPGLR